MIDEDTGLRLEKIMQLVERLLDIPCAFIRYKNQLDYIQQYPFQHGFIDTVVPFINFYEKNEHSEMLHLRHDLASGSDLYIDGLATVDIGFCCAIPLHNRYGYDVGWIYIVSSDRRRMGEEDEYILQTIISLVESEIEQSNKVIYDDLTGLVTRNAFMQIAKRILRVHYLKNTSAAFMFMDLDGFKIINDSYGHAEGDHVLMMFSKFLKIAFRVTDLCARFGGDEFVVMLPNSSEEDSIYVLERFQLLLSEFNATSGLPCEIKVSVGLSNYDGKYCPQVESLIKQADSAMYGQKKRKQIMGGVENI